MVEGFAEGNASGDEVFCGLAVASLVVHAVEVDGVSLKFQLGFFASGYCLLPDIGDVIVRVAADKNFFAVAEVFGRIASKYPFIMLSLDAFTGR